MSLTLKNFKRETGKAFRMLKTQKERGLDREQAFDEWMKENRQPIIEAEPQEKLEIEKDTSRLPKKPLWKPLASATNENKCHWPKCTSKHGSDLVFYRYPINSDHLSEHSMSWIHASLGKRSKTCICRYCKDST